MPSTQRLEWSEFERLCERVAASLDGEQVDLVVGVARGGLPAAVWLSHRLAVPTFGTIVARKTDSDAAFDVTRDSDLSVSGSSFPDCEPRVILAVDDIAAFGDLFAVVRRSLRRRYGADVRIVEASLFADTQQIADGPFAELLTRLVYGADIDNNNVWIEFPWEREAA